MKKTLLAIAAVLCALPTFAGAKGGPKEANERVLACDFDIYNIVFVGGETARVIVAGDGDTDLDLYIYDENKNLITKDDDDTDYCVCSWNPAWTGKFTIKIVNRGNVYNAYKIETN